jgi:hypothetical protein
MTSIMKNLGLDEMGMPWPRNARHVALVGWPKCGKSTVAEMLADEFGCVICDDGLILRQAIPILTGIPVESCFTQEGKASVVRVGDRDEIVRQALGELGNWMEDRYGVEILAERAMTNALREYPDASFYVYPSVRKTQGRAYRRAGGIVIQIDNPWVGVSENDFDKWDTGCVDLVIENDPRTMSLDDLREYIRYLPSVLV